MRKIIVVLASTALSIGLLVCGTYTGTSEGMSRAQALAGAAKPNFVFILADDMRKDDLKYMPKTRHLLKDKGRSFSNAFVSNPLCCPSRATIMRGQYAHNTGVWSNATGPQGGWEGYRTNGNERDNVATRLDGGGYRTGLFGKYFNGYDGSTVPRGWDVWFGGVRMDGLEYYDYNVNDDGKIRHFGTTDKDYLTDVLRRRTKAFIGVSAAHGKPFFAYVAPTAHTILLPLLGATCTLTMA